MLYYIVFVLLFLLTIDIQEAKSLYIELETSSNSFALEPVIIETPKKGGDKLSPSIKEYTSEPEVQEKIRIKALEYNLNPQTMLAIAYAESQFRNVHNYLYDGESGTYSATGIFQITRTTYMAFCGEDKSERFDIDKNIECAMIIASQSGLHHWNESKAGWK